MKENQQWANMVLQNYTDARAHTSCEFPRGTAVNNDLMIFIRTQPTHIPVQSLKHWDQPKLSMCIARVRGSPDAGTTATRQSVN